MSVLALAIVNNHNAPVLIKTRSPASKDDPSDLIFKLHSSLDVVDEKQSSREPFLGVLSQSDNYKIYGYSSATNNKILLMVNMSSIRDNEARAMLKAVYNIFVDVTAVF
ncbi:trafficking protein particle complex subunit 2-like protein [Sarcoptes scabiei]|uniref:Trafficking protein particle complex subunit 2-like protein n=1 Tax=Sarcoptes scabiei TaxID=52283 RepID=A0A132ABX5_SARSC|nr:trafficking protein particle complex subunit 2-like protein [Sarcoptes scabiei]